MTGFATLVSYIALFALAFFIVRFIRNRRGALKDFTSLKTVTFGDESAIKADRWASVISVIVIFVIWGAFTNSKITPVHVPGPFLGEMEFTYTAQNADGQTDDASVSITVYRPNQKVDAAIVEAGDGFAKNDTIAMQAWRTELMKLAKNDEGSDADGYQIIAINGQPIAPGDVIGLDAGKIVMSRSGRISFTPKTGLQMQPLYLPSPEAVVSRFFDLVENGYKGFTLGEHVWASLYRVIVGFVLGSLVGIPLGYAMGLSNWFRGWYDPIVEFMRPVPPLALIPLVIIWFGIGEQGKIVLLFLAALWIMIIAARSGVAGVNISKIHAAYSLGASKRQILSQVIMPNSLPEIFTGARVAMGVCWGTVVAAELVAAQKGIGMMISVAAKFSQTDIVIVGIIIIGVIGFGIDILMRFAEKYLVPWRGRT